MAHTATGPAVTRYSPVSIGFHWMIALSVLATAALGIWLDGLGYYDPWQPRALWLHRAIGTSAFFLMLLKLFWRLYDRKPPLEKNLTRFEAIAATATHHTLTLAVLVLPITGYLVSTSSGSAIPLAFGLELPALVQVGNALRDALMQAHVVIAYGLLALVGIHAMAAVKHQVLDGGQTLQRMLPGRRPLGDR